MSACPECDGKGRGAYPVDEVHSDVELHDPVEHPSHYDVVPGVQVVDILKARLVGKAGVAAWYEGNALKYLLRWDRKDGLQDLKKARKMLDWLIETLEEA